MTFIPAKRKRAKINPRPSSRIICPGHVQWVRGTHECSVAHIDDPLHPCVGVIQSHHSTTRGAWGGDETVVPLCAGHHAQLDSPGWSQKRFEEVYKVDLHAIADELWRVSNHGIKYRSRQS